MTSFIVQSCRIFTLCKLIKETKVQCDICLYKYTEHTEFLCQLPAELVMFNQPSKKD